MRINRIKKEEKRIVFLLAESFNMFVKLDRQHPGEVQEFGEAIHKAQSLIGMRIARRVCPKLFPIKRGGGFINDGRTYFRIIQIY